MNLGTLAKLAGVSVATVSKAFSGSDEISADTREKIFSIAKEHGCYDRYNKNKFDKKVIAVICPELNSDYYNNFITVLDKKISDAGGIMTVSVSNFSSDRESELFAYYSSYCKADGIITINQKSEIINSTDIPFVGIFPGKNCKCPDSITGSLTDAFFDAVKHLKELGHTEIGFIGEKLTQTKAERFKDTLRNLGISVNNDFIAISDGRFEKAGISVIENWVKRGTPLPTAIIAAYDYIAIGVIKCLNRHGYSVPEDISVIGADNISVAPYLETPISTIKTDTELACEKAAELIMKKIKNRFYVSRENIKIKSEYIPRGTTGQAKTKK